MCLSSQEGYRAPVKKDAPLVAWKVVSESYLKGRYDTPYRYRTVRVGVWAKAKRVVISDDELRYYATGFHCYASRDAARLKRGDMRTVVKVLIAGKVLVGWQDGHKVYVADYMKILPPRKEGGA